MVAVLLIQGSLAIAGRVRLHLALGETRQPWPLLEHAIP